MGAGQVAAGPSSRSRKAPRASSARVRRSPPAIALARPCRLRRPESRPGGRGSPWPSSVARLAREQRAAGAVEVGLHGVLALREAGRDLLDREVLEMVELEELLLLPAQVQARGLEPGHALPAFV